VEKRSIHWKFFKNEQEKQRYRLICVVIELNETLTLQCSQKEAKIIGAEVTPLRRMKPTYCYDVPYEAKEQVLSYLKARYIWEQY
jgi:hypothetical protein